MYLCVDLSSKCTGWAKFTNDGKLVKRGRIVPDEKIDPYNKIHFVTTKTKELFGNMEELIIEDIFLGSFAGKFNVDTIKYLARLSGAILYEWIVSKYKIPHFYMASHARKLAGINGHAKKAEVQIAILTKYKFIGVKKIKGYQTSIDEFKAQYKAKKLKKGAFKYRLDKLSRKIKEETDIGEDSADAIVLGIAYYNDKNLGISGEVKKYRGDGDD